MANIYAISDIHGNMGRYKSLMEQLELKPDDTIYIGGDVIDRYPYGIEILKEIMQMDNAKMILGNHEYMMINAIYPGSLPWDHYRDMYDDIAVWYRNGGRVTHDAFDRLSKDERVKIFDYLLSLPTHYDFTVGSQQWQIVHSAPEDCMSWADECRYASPLEFSVWKRGFNFDKIPDGRKVIFGHSPTFMYTGIESGPSPIWHCPNGKAIGIDCGSGYPTEEMRPGFTMEGRLACLRVNDMKEYYSKC